MTVLLAVAAFLGGPVVLAWLKLQITPRTFPSFPQESVTPSTVTPPRGLPAPVERFYRKVCGEGILVIACSQSVTCADPPRRYEARTPAVDRPDVSGFRRS